MISDSFPSLGTGVPLFSIRWDVIPSPHDWADIVFAGADFDEDPGCSTLVLTPARLCWDTQTVVYSEQAPCIRHGALEYFDPVQDTSLAGGVDRCTVRPSC